jgi:hypothetical protein
MYVLTLTLRLYLKHCRFPHNEVVLLSFLGEFGGFRSPRITLHCLNIDPGKQG